MTLNGDWLCLLHQLPASCTSPRCSWLPVEYTGIFVPSKLIQSPENSTAFQYNSVSAEGVRAKVGPFPLPCLLQFFKTHWTAWLRGWPPPPRLYVPLYAEQPQAASQLRTASMGVARMRSCRKLSEHSKASQPSYLDAFDSLCLSQEAAPLGNGLDLRP